MSEARPWTDVDLSHLKNVECTTTYDLLVCERAADHIRTLEAVQADLLAHIRDLETQLARARELPEKWRSDWKDNRQHDAYTCADELEAALQSAAGPGSNQPELDNPKSAG